jgi:DNA primase
VNRDRTDVDRVKRALADMGPQRFAQALSIDRGAKLKGANFTICCPWHSDRNPSCSLRVTRDGELRAHCFACKAGGDAIAIVAHVHGLDVRSQFGEALRTAAAIGGIHLEECAARTVEPDALDDRSYDNVAEALLALCPLSGSLDVERYVHRRGIFPDAEAAGCGGLPPPGEQGAVLAALRRQFAEETLRRAGIVRADGTLAWPSHRLLIPWRNADGTLAVIQRRAIASLADGPKYTGPRGRKPRNAFGSDAAVEVLASEPGAPVVIVEGALDALAYRKLLRHSTNEPRAILGLWSATADGASVRWASGGRDVILATDADDAGDACAKRLATELRGVARSVRRQRPRFGDWGSELLQRCGVAA